MKILKLIISFICAFGKINYAHAQNDQIVFTNTNSKKILNLEKEIAYFYGAKNSSLIANHYIQAIKKLEYIGLGDKNVLKEEMLPHLIDAYSQVLKQTNFKFDVINAAQLEFNLIIAQSEQLNFEKINQIMVLLYKEIFKSNDYKIFEAAMLRTFLYKYKITLMNSNRELSDADINLIMNLARTSEEKLNSITRLDL